MWDESLNFLENISKYYRNCNEFIKMARRDLTMAAFRDVMPCSPVQHERRFRSVYCLHTTAVVTFSSDGKTSSITDSRDLTMSSGMLRRVVLYNMTDVSEVITAYKIRSMMEAVRTSETSVNCLFRYYTPQKRHSRRLENVKFHLGGI
jgi:hypothetical protein